ncbi:hypothetical protein BLA29_006484, partial [Euroglyphus maynei]
YYYHFNGITSSRACCICNYDDDFKNEFNHCWYIVRIYLENNDNGTHARRDTQTHTNIHTLCGHFKLNTKIKFKKNLQSPEQKIDSI